MRDNQGVQGDLSEALLAWSIYATGWGVLQQMRWVCRCGVVVVGHGMEWDGMGQARYIVGGSPSGKGHVRGYLEEMVIQEGA